MRTTWINTLSKSQVIEILTQLKLAFDDKASIDELRKIVRRHVSDSNKRNQSSVTEIKPKLKVETDQTGVNVNKSEHRIIHTMAGDNTSTKLEFHLGQDDWDTYTERLELYFLANDTPVGKQAAVLLTKISAETYKLVRDLCAPNKPSTKTFDEIVSLIKNHLAPKPSETIKRRNFHQAQQATTESVAEFAARLKRLSMNCNFPEANADNKRPISMRIKGSRYKNSIIPRGEPNIRQSVQTSYSIRSCGKKRDSHRQR